MHEKTSKPPSLTQSIMLLQELEPLLQREAISPLRRRILTAGFALQISMRAKSMGLSGVSAGFYKISARKLALVANDALEQTISKLTLKPAGLSNRPV